MKTNPHAPQPPPPLGKDDYERDYVEQVNLDAMKTAPTPAAGATPQTDEAAKSSVQLFGSNLSRNIVSADFARTLERQRDEARRLLTLEKRLTHDAGLALKAHSLGPSASRETMALESEAVLRYENAQLRRELEQAREDSGRIEFILSNCEVLLHGEPIGSLEELDNAIYDAARSSAAKEGKVL